MFWYVLVLIALVAIEYFLVCEFAKTAYFLYITGWFEQHKHAVRLYRIIRLLEKETGIKADICFRDMDNSYKNYCKKVAHAEKMKTHKIF